MDDTHHDVVATVDKFVEALSTGDAASLDALFTGDAEIWHNYDQISQPASEALAALAGLAQLKPRYEIVGRDLVEGVCIQRHLVHIALPSGESAAIPAIQRITVTDSQIRRIDEYMDSAQIAAAMHAMHAG